MINLLSSETPLIYSAIPNDSPDSFDRTIFLYFHLFSNDLMIAVHPENFEEFSKCIHQGNLMTSLIDTNLIASMVTGDFKSPSVFFTKSFFLDEDYIKNFTPRSIDNMNINNSPASLSHLAHVKTNNVESRAFYQNKCMPPFCHFSYDSQEIRPRCKNCKPIVLYDFVRKVKNQDVSDVYWNVQDLAVVDHCLMPKLDKLTTFMYHYIRNNVFARSCDGDLALQMPGKTVIEIYNKFSSPSI
ncbi:uncharacterized protein SAPINGB_P000631 [Magnusiomyces paraingens]|uniref:Uncharacterized protein n=1 Tax=Magnusiomyces paraingens TaxID=2606893 RepID=A0A5E8B8H5_9ASCO|nr:uncharacterized protein SAPINGB_P000631 [Saprochaete ingens]VVT45081.1 unnamed protein product [Saprochaete ingens]